MLFTHSETLIPQTSTASQRPGAVRLAGRALSHFSRAGGAIWRYLEDVGQARANHEVRLLAACWANTDPGLASQLRAASTFNARSQDASSPSSQHHAMPNSVVGITS